MTNLLIEGAYNKLTGDYTEPSQAVNCKDSFICIECNDDLIVKNGEIRRVHFSHKSNSNCKFYNRSTDIHKLGIIILKKILKSKIPLTITQKCDKCNKNNIVSIDIINDNSQVKEEAIFNYKGDTKHADLAYYDNNDIKYIFEIYYTHKTKSSDRPEPWFEIDALELQNVNLNAKTVNLNCIRNCNCNYYKNQIEVILTENSIIYFNQRGAGCGKTYESIQLTVNDKRFIDKDLFIYLTKQHSAKEVIYNELKNQFNRGALSDLQEIPSEKDYIGKQYTINYFNKVLKKQITIIIGTIDSFTYNTVKHSNVNKYARDYFNEIVNTIKKGYIDLDIRYGGKSPKLNDNCLIIIDEAQDLQSDYIEAFNKILLQTGIDIYIIGDKLQSISSDLNIYTYITNKTTLEGHTIINISNGINKVMRFHNIQFIDFVNNIINYDTYNLPQITNICSINNCKYIHENDKTPYTLFQVPPIYNNDYDNDKIDIIIEKIISYMKIEIDNYNYLPHNFMFIFPFVSKNSFAQILEARLQSFWIDIFKNKKYQSDILNNDNYWKDKINDNKIYEYVKFHKSEENKPINLKESEYATRILSIHASKGNGCEVVFLLGITENGLKRFSNGEVNLVYESLLHVAITRQKKSLYIGIEFNNDDIYQRFKPFNVIEDNNIKITLPKKLNINPDKICNFSINENILQGIKLPEENKLDKPLLDYGHHIIRMNIMIYQLYKNIINNENVKNDYKKQILVVLNKIKNINVERYEYKEYVKNLRKINNLKKINKEIKEIPILTFSRNDKTIYYKYTNILINFINNIQHKLRDSLKQYKLPDLCPLEAVILIFIVKIKDNGIFCDISNMEIYNILYNYSIAYDNQHTDDYKCCCNQLIILLQKVLKITMKILNILTKYLIILKII